MIMILVCTICAWIYTPLSCHHAAVSLCFRAPNVLEMAKAVEICVGLWGFGLSSIAKDTPRQHKQISRALAAKRNTTNVLNRG